MVKSRLVVGLSLAGIASASLLAPGIIGGLLFLTLCLALGVTAVWEFFSMSRRLGLPGLPRMTAAATVLYISILAVGGVLGAGPAIGPGPGLELLLVTAFIVLGFMHVFFSTQRRDALSALFVSAAGFGLIVWPLTFIVRLYFMEGLDMSGRLLLVFLLAVTKMADVGAYTFGSWSARLPRGNHKIVPILSPKKSWEGLIAGILVSVGTALALVALAGPRMTIRGFPVLGYLSAACLGVTAAVLGFAGDLAESALKRAAGAKNSGNLPGLGGVLDALDSLLFTAPAFYAYLSIVGWLSELTRNAV